MACLNCAKIRAAILHGKMAEAAGLTVEALREKIGFKVEAPKPGGFVKAVESEPDVPESFRPAPKRIKVK